MKSKIIIGVIIIAIVVVAIFMLNNNSKIPDVPEQDLSSETRDTQMPTSQQKKEPDNTGQSTTQTSQYTTIEDAYNSGQDTKCESANASYFISKNKGAVRVQQITPGVEINMLGTKTDFYQWTSVTETVAHMTGAIAETQFGVLLRLPINNTINCSQQFIQNSIFTPPKN